MSMPVDHPTRTELLLCSMLSGGSACDADLTSLPDSEWDELVQQASRHGVGPLLYRRLKGSGPDGGVDGVPERVVDRLRSAYLGCATRNTLIYHRLTEVFDALRDAGIPVIPLKGAHLAELVYGNVALRSLGDVDLLVRKSDLAGAAEALEGVGYRPSQPFWIEATCATSHQLPPFIKTGGPVIEVHWTIERPGGPFRIDLDGLWQRAQPADINGSSVLVLSPEDLMLHLCLHACFHHRLSTGARALCDVASVIRRDQGGLHWEQVAARAREWGATKPVYLTLWLAREWVGAAVPPDVLDDLAPADLNPGLVAQATEQLFGAQPSGSLPMSSNFMRIWNVRGLRGKVAGFLRFTFPSRETMATMYPAPPSSGRIYLYYPARLKDVLVRYGRSAWRLLRRDEVMLAAARREDNGNALVDWLARP